VLLGDKEIVESYLLGSYHKRPKGDTTSILYPWIVGHFRKPFCQSLDVDKLNAFLK